jgi:hypothetical protein
LNIRPRRRLLVLAAPLRLGTWRLPVISSYRLIRVGKADRLTRAALLGLLLEDITTARYDPM